MKELTDRQKTVSEDKQTFGSVENLKLFQKFYDFMTYFEPIVEKFPNFEKSAWCAEVKKQMIRMLRIIIVTNKSRQKAAGWHDFDTELTVLKLYIRRFREKKYLSTKSYEHSVKLLAEIGKITGGLIKLAQNAR